MQHMHNSTIYKWPPNNINMKIWIVVTPNMRVYIVISYCLNAFCQICIIVDIEKNKNLDMVVYIIFTY
jgi:hypothetical protein